MTWILVFIGGGMGSLLRYGISLVLKNSTLNFPLSTLISNVLASFVIGILTALVLKGAVNDEQKLLLATGFCGGFSTFSTFSNETLQLFQQGNIFSAFFNIVISVALCLLATFLGMKILMS